MSENSSIVEIVYRAPDNLEGIELMGVDAGLSWIKGKSIMLKQEESEDDVANFVVNIEVIDSCEFRARGFDSEEDRWEAGLANHRIERNEDGTISFKTELDADLFYFKGSLPTEMEPTLEEATERINHVEDQDVPLFQVLVDLSLWIDQLYANPLEEEYVYRLSGLMRHIKRKSRKVESKKLDKVVRPVLKALFGMYKGALEFYEEDVRFLTGEWDSKDYITIIKNLPKEVEILANDPDLGVGTDAGDRFKNLLKYVS